MNSSTEDSWSDRRAHRRNENIASNAIQPNVEDQGYGIGRAKGEVEAFPTYQDQLEHLDGPHCSVHCDHDTCLAMRVRWEARTFYEEAEDIAPKCTTPALCALNQMHQVDEEDAVLRARQDKLLEFASLTLDTHPDTRIQMTKRLCKILSDALFSLEEDHIYSRNRVLDMQVHVRIKRAITEFVDTVPENPSSILLGYLSDDLFAQLERPLCDFARKFYPAAWNAAMNRKPQSHSELVDRLVKLHPELQKLSRTWVMFADAYMGMFLARAQLSA
ncbi:hypothetical protein BS50DRAFT_635830 [Corynespora cassiicola Philippines]|uniref:Uncharacterized protein n=1 Tax=Corynespora cassiicola Philippines TaxID=1448308 RepID=A0A2T2NHU2_CORCC|nr:hypothetical protein BS50DRAFT_635830 [Corynespora cassiicola Philippines]